MSCPFKVLSVPKTATLAEIKTAYRRLALQLHPDTNGGDKEKSERFKKVSAAYDTLTDPEQRKKYEFESSMRNASQWGSGRGGYTVYTNHTPRYAHGQEFHFNQAEWDAYHYGIDEDEFDFFSGEEVVIEMVNGKPHARRSSRKKGGGKNNGRRQRQEDIFHGFSESEIEDIIRNSGAFDSPEINQHYRHQQQWKSNTRSHSGNKSHNRNNTSKVYGQKTNGMGGSSSTKKRSSRRRRGGGGNEDCVVS
mmetsp:Transcript_4072/g.6309  ORF Transcript_4072/g.6309 Transcript_4072/m.6309 type:complete len:249 (+) Transcript_4072:70-816(+)